MFLLLFAVIVLPLRVYYVRQPFDPILRPGQVWYVATRDRVMTFHLAKERKTEEVLIRDIGVMERRERHGGTGHLVFTIASGDAPLAQPYTIGPIEDPQAAFRHISALRLAARGGEHRADKAEPV